MEIEMICSNCYKEYFHATGLIRKPKLICSEECEKDYRKKNRKSNKPTGKKYYGFMKYQEFGR